MVSKRSLRWQEGQTSDGQEIVPEEDLLCPLCGRELIRGDSVDEHHLIPRSQGGRDKYLIHKVCHQKIHQMIKPRELAKAFNTWQAESGLPLTTISRVLAQSVDAARNPG